MRRSMGPSLDQKTVLLFLVILFIGTTLFFMLSASHAPRHKLDPAADDSVDSALAGFDLSSLGPHQLMDFRRRLTQLLEQIPNAQQELNRRYEDFERKKNDLLDVVSKAQREQAERRNRQVRDDGGVGSTVRGYGEDGKSYVYDKNSEVMDRSKVFGSLYSNPGNHPPYIMSLQILIHSLRHTGSKAPFVVFHLDPWEVVEKGITPANVSALRELDVEFR